MGNGVYCHNLELKFAVKKSQHTESNEYQEQRKKSCVGKRQDR